MEGDEAPANSVHDGVDIRSLREITPPTDGVCDLKRSGIFGQRKRWTGNRRILACARCVARFARLAVGFGGHNRHLLTEACRRCRNLSRCATHRANAITGEGSDDDRPCSSQVWLFRDRRLAGYKCGFRTCPSCFASSDPAGRQRIGGQDSLKC